MSLEQQLRKSERLRLNREFTRVFARNCKAGDGALVVYAAKNDLGWSRLGLRVGKRMGNATRRNYVRRRIREAFRAGKADMPKGFDIVCVALPRAKDPSCDIARSLRALIVKATLADEAGSMPRPGSDGAVT